MILGPASGGEYRTGSRHSSPKNSRTNSWQTSRRAAPPDGCAELTWNADALLQPGQWSPLFETIPCPLTVALSLWKTGLWVLTFVFGIDRLEPASTFRVGLPRKQKTFEVTAMSLQSPMAFLDQYWAIAPSLVTTIEREHVESARNAQAHLRDMGLHSDETSMPRSCERENR